MTSQENTKSRIRLAVGDITEIRADAIVNAANAFLKMGGGVAGAILKKGGREIQDECDKIGFIGVGSAAVTTAGKLKAGSVIHAVGPRMGEGDEDAKLAKATVSALRIASEKKMDSVAFPAISTGIFGYPLAKCALIMISETKAYLGSNSFPKEVIFCLYDNNAHEIFRKALEAA